MRKMLFEPFDFTKWLIIGFNCFLASVHTYFSSGGNYSGGDVDLPYGAGIIGALENRFGDLAPVILGIMVVLLIAFTLVVITLMLAVIWLSCRGTFMFMDNVARDRAQVVAPWKQYAQQGWQLFYLVLALTGGFLLLVSFFAAVIFVLSNANILELDDPSLPEMLLFLGTVSGLCIAGGIAVFLVKTVAVPRMYIQKCGVLKALKDGWELVLIYPLEWIAFMFVNIGLWLISTALVLFFCLFTCCIAVFPVVNQVLMLPLYVFLLSYQLAFLAQFGSGWNVFESKPPVLS